MDPALSVIPAPGAGTSPSPTPGEDYEVNLVSLNQWQIAWRRFKRHRLAVFGAVLFLSICVIAIVGPFILPYDFQKIPTPQLKCAGTEIKATYGCPPSLDHLMGTTARLQRDVLTLVVNGARISLAIGVGASVFSAIIGAIVGGIAGYFGGWIDNLLMRIVDVLLSLPLLFVILVVAKFIGSGNWVIILVVFAAFGWPGIARLVRSLFLSLRGEVFVEAARAVGVSNLRIIFRHILPNAVSPIIVATTLSVAGVIVGEAFVSYLGFGVDITQPTWGNALSDSQSSIINGDWWWPFFPGMAIVLTVLGINFMGDGLRDALDPKSRV
ncbi:MAG: ABC transporter permease [Chloroflexi bacterium]|nr:ABC transporter permease [Chloroflexota bacterium]